MAEKMVRTSSQECVSSEEIVHLASHGSGGQGTHRGSSLHDKGTQGVLHGSYGNIQV